MTHIRQRAPLLREPAAAYLRCHPYDSWQMGPHYWAVLRRAEALSLPVPDVFFDNGCLSRGPLPQLRQLLRAIDDGRYGVLLLPGPFVLSLDDRRAQDLLRWIRGRGCRVEELPTPRCHHDGDRHRVPAGGGVPVR